MSFLSVSLIMTVCLILLDYSSIQLMSVKSVCINIFSSSEGFKGNLFIRNSLVQKLNNIMIDPERKQKLFFSKAEHQLKQIEFTCRQVISLSQQIALFANDINSTQVNARKIEFLKTEIKDKLKQFAGFVDEVYKILDRKIMVLTTEISKQLKNKSINNVSDKQFTNGSLNRSHIVQKDSQKTNQRTQSNQSYEQDHIFTDTLNPRVTFLQSKIAQYENREALLNSKIEQLKAKNEKLLQQFTRLSSASNKKINQLSFQLSSRLVKEKDSFSSIDSRQMLKNQSKQKQLKPMLLFDPTEVTHNSSPTKRERGFHSSDHEYQMYFDQQTNARQADKARPLAFGCMPSATKRKEQPLDILKAPKIVGEKVQNLDKQDKTRRFDLLLNKLRISQQDIKSSQQDMSNKTQDYQSVFSQNVVKRYQI